jgi:Rrf2 family transcriptional regulator, iron-sulfur cluster assembly transcription factor
MKLVTKGWIAVPAMIELALRETGTTTCGEISKRHKVSESYLEQIFRKLRRSGLAKSVSGPGGGHWLAKDQEEISVADIIAAVDGRKHGEFAKHERHGRCSVTQKLLVKINEELFASLQSVTLKQLVEQHRAEQSFASSTSAARQTIPNKPRTTGRPRSHTDPVPAQRPPAV